MESTNTKTDSRIKIQNIVEMIILDTSTLRSWYFLSDKLDCRADLKERCETLVQKPNGFYQAFTEILTDWMLRSNGEKTVTDLCEIFKQMDCIYIKEKLEETHGNAVIEMPPPPPSTKIREADVKEPISYGLSLPTPSFTGRHSELKKLQTFYNEKKNLVLICGLGGIGKTELCRQFLKNISTVNRIWLNGDKIETLKHSVESLAANLSIKSSHSSPSELFQSLAKNVAENKLKSIIVIDNVDTKYDEVLKIIKLVRVSDNIFVMVTSRNKSILENSGQTIFLDVLDKDQTKTLIQTCIENVTDSEADSLCQLLQNFPLAIQQAVAYIKEQRNDYETEDYSVSHYIREFKEKNSEMLDQKLSEFEHGYARTTLITWNMTISKFSLEAVEILKILAFLEPDRIEVNFLKEICHEFGFKDPKPSLNLIKNYSFVKIENLVISIHRLVQQVMRLTVTKEYSKRLFNIVVKIFAMRDEKNFSMGQVFYHFNSVSENAFGMTFDWQLAKKGMDEDTFIYHWKTFMANKLHLNSKYQDSIEMCKEILESKYCDLYETAYDILFRSTMKIDKCPNKAVEYLQSLLESKATVYGHDNIITIEIKIILVKNFEKTEEMEQSSKLFNQVRDYYKRNPPLEENDREIVKIRICNWNGMTRDDILKEFGDFDYLSCLKRVADFERVLKYYKKILGESDPLTLKVKHVMANRLCYEERYFECLKVFTELINSGVESHVVAALNAMFEVGCDHYSEDRYKEARDVFIKVIELRRIHLAEDDDDVDIIDTKEMLAATFVQLNEIDKALALYEYLLTWSEKKLGADHECTVEYKEKIHNLKIQHRQENV